MKELSPSTSKTVPVAVNEIKPAQELGSSDLMNSTLHHHNIQFKLKVGSPDDPLEQEADSMAETIMRMHEPNLIQRKCSHCEEEDRNVQRKPLASYIQRKEASSGMVASNAVSDQINASKGSGNRMEGNTRAFMEGRFGADFSNVNIHSGHEAIQMNRELNAKAFTVGSDIYFNQGQYNPDSNDGKHLLAHELTHTMQQGGRANLQTKLIQRQEDEDLSVLTEAPPPMPVFPLGISPVEHERVRQGYLSQRNAYRERLRNAVLAPLESRQRADAITFTNRLRSLSRMQASLLVLDDVFFTRIRRWFSGKALWSVFSILYFNNHTPEPYLRLNYAVMNSNARLLTDMLSIIIHEYPSDRYFDMLREVCLTIFSGDRLLPEILRLIDHRADVGISYQLSGQVQEVHYEPNTTGGFALSTPSNRFSADAYFSGRELRAIVRIHFVDGSDPVHCTYATNPDCEPFYFLGDNAHYYDEFLGYITNVWNNKFYITNGRSTYSLTFVPIFMAGHENADPHVRIISNPTQHCASGDTWARSYSSCWHLRGVSENMIAHEFGHLIGASDEYNLPGSVQEVTAGGITGLSAEDLSLSTVEGITGTAAPVSSSGHGQNVDSLMSNANNNVYERHLTRLIRSLNESLPAGTSRFNIRRRN